ncbi:YkgJ family cysteine cluster protein [Candidatus Auribacterota bacterium]
MFWNFFKQKRFKVKIIGLCHTCGKCCDNLILVHKGKPIKEMSQFDDLVRKRPFYNYFKFIYRDKKVGFLYFSCSKLGEDKKCTVYENRPAICCNYPQKHIVKYGGRLLSGCGFKIVSKKSFAQVLQEER